MKQSNMSITSQAKAANVEIRIDKDGKSSTVYLGIGHADAEYMFRSVKNDVKKI